MSSEISKRRHGFSRRRLIQGGAAVAGGLALAPANRAFGRGGAPELILTNGRFVTLDPSKPEVRAVAISGGAILATGSRSQIEALAGPSTETVDLGGRMVLPGIHDGHSHPLSGGRVLSQPSLNYEVLDLEEFLARLEELLAETSADEPDGWLNATLWDASSMSRLPTKADLATLDTSRPILVVAVDGHIAVANQRALDIAGIDADTPDPDGGEIGHSGSGEPNGQLFDAAIRLVSSQIPAPTPEQDARALLAAHREMSRRGITSTLEASAGESQLAAIRRLTDDGDSLVRQSEAIRVDAEEAEDTAAMLERLESLREDYGSEQIPIRTVKMFFDGVIEYPTQTAALIRPYKVNKGTDRNPRWEFGNDNGPTYFPQEVADDAIAALDAAGWQVHVHAIGDRGTRSALNAFARARRANGRTDNRHTITHLELVSGGDPARFGELGVLASMQMQWAERDSYTVKKVRDHLGEKRWRRLYPSGTLQRAGAMLCGGSDWPVDPLLPFRQIEMAVNRTADEIYPGDDRPLFSGQGLTLAQSLRMHIRNSAFQLHQEGLSGRIRPGLAADLIVLDRDVLAVPLKRVSKTKVVRTILAGRTVHDNGELG